MKKKFIIFLFVIISVITFGEKIMRVGLGVPESHFEYKGMKIFKENIESKTDIKVELYPSNQIGVDQEVLEQIKFGAAQMNLPDPAVLGTFVKEFQFLSFPFIFDNLEEAMKVGNGPWGEELLGKLEKAGYVGLGFGPFGFRHVTNNVRDIKTLEDFKGLKIRTMQNSLHLKVFRALGANPTPMAFTELFSGLQQGVVDGQENPLMNIYSNKLYEVQKYGTLTGHVFSWVVLVVGKDFFNALNKEEQTVVKDSAKLAIKYMEDSVVKEDKRARNEMAKVGLNFLEPSEKLRNDIKDRVSPILKKEGNKINKKMYSKLIEATK